MYNSLYLFSINFFFNIPMFFFRKKISYSTFESCFQCASCAKDQMSILLHNKLKIFVFELRKKENIISINIFQWLRTWRPRLVHYTFGQIFRQLEQISRVHHSQKIFIYVSVWLIPMYVSNHESKQSIKLGLIISSRNIININRQTF